MEMPEENRPRSLPPTLGPAYQPQEGGGRRTDGEKAGAGLV